MVFYITIYCITPFSTFDVSNRQNYLGYNIDKYNIYIGKLMQKQNVTNSIAGENRINAVKKAHYF